MIRILLKYNDTVVRDMETDKSEITIGRDPENDIQIDSLAVSRVHARIIRGSNYYLIEDLNSTNSTFVNGKKISKKYLMENDEITIGKHDLFVYFENHGHKPSVWKGSSIDKTYKLSAAQQR